MVRLHRGSRPGSPLGLDEPALGRLWPVAVTVRSDDESRRCLCWVLQMCDLVSRPSLMGLCARGRPASAVMHLCAVARHRKLVVDSSSGWNLGCRDGLGAVDVVG